MAGFWPSLKRGTRAVGRSFGPGEYSVVGETVQCPHCGGAQFEKGSAQLNTAGMTFLNLDWANKSATTLACTTCGRIQWFLREPQRLGG
jgi:predicted nucleic-acid-binding Zn-ribbon protein